jgi:2-amino-4-hydroxy-6-hydroxymethyldihydropteridine diphosphokinase
MPAATCAFVGLGANLGDGVGALRSALTAIAQLPATELVACSRFYSSAPVDAGGPDYTNAVAQLSTRLDPFKLLGMLQAIERAHGRERPYPNAPRRLDLDLLLYGERVIDTPVLRLPHPRMHARAFVLRPLSELAPALVIPGRGSVQDLLGSVADQRLNPIDA